MIEEHVDDSECLTKEGLETPFSPRYSMTKMIELVFWEITSTD